jgi:hypothetical protein
VTWYRGRYSFIVYDGRGDGNAIPRSDGRQSGALLRALHNACFFPDFQRLATFRHIVRSPAVGTENM